jgi:hypothetical protein
MFASTGCQTREDTVARFNRTPLEIDEATQYRNYQLSVVNYPDGGIEAGPTLFPYEASDTGVWQAFTGPGIFTGQAIASPITYFVMQGWSAQTYRGVIFEPTYTGVAPLLPESDNSTATVASDVPVVQPVEDGGPSPAGSDPQ